MWNNLLFYFYLFIIGRILPLILVRVRFFEVSHGNLLVKIYQSDLLVYCCIALRTLKGQVELVALYILVIPPHLSGRKIRVSKCVTFGYSFFSTSILSDALYVSLTSGVSKLHKWNLGPNEVKGNFAVDLNEIWISFQEIVCLHICGFFSFLIPPSVTPNLHLIFLVTAYSHTSQF